MCLEKIVGQYESVPDEDGPECGWKVFTSSNPQGSELQSVYLYRLFQESTVAVADANVELYTDNGKYLSGFHIYLNRSDAVKLAKIFTLDPDTHPTIRRVSFWGNVVWGRERTAPVIVSQNMLIHARD